MSETPPAAPFDTTVTDALLSTTRAVRRRLDYDRPVDPEVILECIGLAQQTPTATNEQDWRWLVVTDDAKKAGLAEIYRGGCLEYLERNVAETAEGHQRPMLNVFHRDGETIRHVWGSELFYAPTDPGQDPRHVGTLEPLWNLFDLTPEGRPTDWDEQLSYPDSQ